jgi:iron complex transport system substrate-binding protein
MGITSEDEELNFAKKGILIALTFFTVCGYCPVYPTQASGARIKRMEITDDIGFRVELEAPVTRIISLYVGHTENLIAIGAGGRIVAASSGDDPKLLENIPLLGAKPGLEQIISLKPDIVLTRPMQARSQEALYGRLRSMGVRVLAIDPPTWDEFPKYIALLSELVGDPDPGLVSEEAKRLLSADPPSAGQVNAILITNGRSMATCTPDSWAAHMLALAGFRNVASDVSGVSPGSVIAGFGAERLLSSSKNIEVVLLQQGAMNTMRAADFVSDPRFSVMKAVREGKVFDVAEADISRPSLLRLRSGVVRDMGKLVTSGGQ